MTDRIQALMNSAYERYQANPSMTNDEFLDQCTAPEAAAVRLGNFNYQVGNGGFSQYWYNSYATRSTVAALKKDIRYIRDHAKLVGDPRVAAVEKVLGLYIEFDQVLRGENDPNKRPVSSGWGDEDEEEEDAGARIEAARLDSRYYEVGDDFMDVAELWINATFAA